jgi:hypothetical protein
MSTLSEKASSAIDNGFEQFWERYSGHFKGIDVNSAKVIWMSGFAYGTKFGTSLGVNFELETLREVSRG